MTQPQSELAEFVENIMRQVAQVGFREGYRAAKPDATDEEIDKVWRERRADDT